MKAAAATRPTSGIDRAAAMLGKAPAVAGGRAIAPLAEKPDDCAAEFGPRPDLVWLPVEQLVVEDAYQRAIGERGLANVRAMVRHFRWSRFTPLIVAPREDGFFAVIDGQHRATAAATLGIRALPAQMVAMGPEERAEAFSYINGAVTALSTMQKFHAAVAARLPLAVAAARALKAAGARVLAYPLSAKRMAVGDTLAAGSLLRAVEMFGEPALRTALKGLVAQKKPGTLGAAMITGAARWAKANAARYQSEGGEEALVAALGALDPERLIAEARQRALGAGGKRLELMLVDEIAAQVQKTQAAKAAAEQGPSLPAPAGRAVTARNAGFTEAQFTALLIKAGVAFGCDRHRVLEPGDDDRAADAQVAVIAFLDARGAAPAIAAARPKEWARFEALAADAMGLRP